MITLGWFLVIFVTTPILAGLFFVFILTKVMIRWHHGRFLDYARVMDSTGERIRDLTSRVKSEDRSNKIDGALDELALLSQKMHHHMEERDRWQRLRNRLLR